MSDPSVFFSFTDSGDAATAFLSGSFIRTPGSNVRDFYTLVIDDASSYTGSILVQEQSFDATSGNTVRSSTIITAASNASHEVKVQASNAYRIKPNSDFSGTVTGILHSGALS